MTAGAFALAPPDVAERVNSAVARLQAESEAVVALSGSRGIAAQRRLGTLLRGADRYLGQRLLRWAAANGGDQARFTPASAVAYRAQVRVVLDQVQGTVRGETAQNVQASWAAGAAHASAALTSLETAYTGIARTPRIREALQFDPQVGRRAGSVLRSYETSVDRYGRSMIQQFEAHLALGFAAGLSQYEMIEMLTGHGGPRGEVSLRARVVGGQVVRTQTAQIPEGLFVRNRYWAERIVRTESANAYNAARLDRLDQLAAQGLALKKKILAHFDRRTAWDSIGVHGQVRDLAGPGSYFTDGVGRVYEHPPARPNDRETVIPWQDEWGEVTSTAPLTPAERETAQERIAAGKMPFDLAARRVADIATEHERASAVRTEIGTRFAEGSSSNP